MTAMTATTTADGGPSLRGLPEPLPENERLLWQGSPDWRVLARRVFHLRKLAAYFALILAWVAASALTSDAPPAEAALSILRAIGVSLIPLALIAAYSWLVARSSVYTITDRRVVMGIGLALPVSMNLPYTRIESADLNARPDGTGDIALLLRTGDKLAYAVLWPHARPLRFSRPQPTLRGLRDVHQVAQTLSRALAASADMAAPVLHNDTQAAAAIPHATMAA